MIAQVVTIPAHPCRMAMFVDVVADRVMEGHHLLLQAHALYVCVLRYCVELDPIICLGLHKMHRAIVAISRFVHL